MNGHPSPNYINIAIGKQMDPENVSNWFIEDLNKLLQATVNSLRVSYTGHPIVLNMELRKGIKGLELWTKIDSVYVKEEARGYKP